MTQDEFELKMVLEFVESINLGSRSASVVQQRQVVAVIEKALAKEKALQALQALHNENERLGLYKDAYAEQEPVAWLDGPHLVVRVDMRDRLNYKGPWVDLGRAIPDKWTPILYTTPPQRKPLTHEQRFDLLTKFEPHKNKWEAPAILIDMVEAAHGIKENT